jgi:hypothetical protein
VVTKAEHIIIPRNSSGKYFCRRQNFVEFRPETRKNAGILQNRRRIQKMPDLQWVYVKTTKYRKDTHLQLRWNYGQLRRNCGQLRRNCGE